MKRTIVAPPVLTPAALGELKAWLGLSTARDDAELVHLLGAAIEVCEGFTGALPLSVGCEEVLDACSGWLALSGRPVQAITALAALGPTGTRRALLPADWTAELDADGGGRVRLVNPVSETRLVATYVAGLAADWNALPEALRQGLIRLAAHQHRERDADRPAPFPPAAVAALWRPWRRMRLA